MIREFSPQLAKALYPIEVTEFGMVMVLRLEHPEKAADPIVVTVSGISNW
jgi:hypothetical protein